MIFLVCVSAVGPFLGRVGVFSGYFLGQLTAELEFGPNIKVIAYRLSFPTTPSMRDLEL